MDPAAASVTLDRDTFNTFWTCFLALMAFVLWEWNSILGPEKKADPKDCAKHPGTDRCVCRRNLPGGKK